MSEPIKLFDRDGNLVTRYSPNMAQMEVAAGLLFATPPVKLEIVANGVTYRPGADAVTLDMRADTVDGVTVSTECVLLRANGEVIASTRRPIGYKDMDGVRTYYFPDDVDADMPALDGMPGDDEPTPAHNAKLMREYVERVERKVGRPRKGTGGVL